MQDIYQIIVLFEASGFKEPDVITFFERLDHFKTQIPEVEFAKRKLMAKAGCPVSTKADIELAFDEFAFTLEKYIFAKY